LCQRYSAFVSETLQKKRSFQDLPPNERREWIEHPSNIGFIGRVVARLAEEGVAVSRSTVSRTWNREYVKPNPVVVAAVEAEYQTQRPRSRAGWTQQQRDAHSTRMVAIWKTRRNKAA
jgi:hypothetical protein